VSDIQRESQAVLDSSKENDFHGTFGAWKKNVGIAVYVPKETILKEMAAKSRYVKPAFLFWSSPGTFRYTSYIPYIEQIHRVKQACPLHMTADFLFDTCFFLT
jgi:hypothetical protein